MTHLDRTVAANLDVLFSMIPAIRDGNTDAIHAARVATRRLRAALPLVGGDSDTGTEPAETIRRFGRALGRVREIDVALEQLQSVEPSVPAAGGAIAELRIALTRRQWREHRRLIKIMEELPLESLRTAAPGLGLRAWLKRDRRWVAVAGAMAEHSRQLRDSVTAASGVYFPNRAHRVRVDVKKLRYVLELAPHAAGARTGIKRLKAAQDVLGRLHDHQALVDFATSATYEDKSGRDALVAALRAASHALFREYLGHRAQVLQVCDEVGIVSARGAWQPTSLRNALLTASVIAAPSAVLFLAKRSGRGKRPMNPQIRSTRDWMLDNPPGEMATASPRDAEHLRAGALVRAGRHIP